MFLSREIPSLYKDGGFFYYSPMIRVIDLGTVEYGEAWKIQWEIRDALIGGRGPETLLLLEHPPVITMGKRGADGNIRIPREFLEARGISVIDVERGGDVTYHGPGQLVGYPLLNLASREPDLHLYVDCLEEVFVRLLEERFRIRANRDKGKYTGVYVGSDKLTAIGIAVKSWVTYHGFACNVNTDLTPFSWMVPCGLADRGVTSLEKLTGEKQDMDAIKRDVARLFGEVFHDRIQWEGTYEREG